eukprot:1139600-Pelagomonas_calceolata.AAC.1
MPKAKGGLSRLHHPSLPKFLKGVPCSELPAGNSGPAGRRFLCEYLRKKCSPITSEQAMQDALCKRNSLAF